MHNDELVKHGMKGFQLKSASLIQHKCYFMVSVALTVMYSHFVALYLLFDSAPGLLNLIQQQQKEE